MGAKIQADEISSIIKERIDNFELNVDVNETGKIISFADGVAQVYGKMERKQKKQRRYGRLKEKRKSNKAKVGTEAKNKGK